MRDPTQARTAIRENPKAAERVQQTIGELKKHLALRFDVATLAGLSGLSPSHFTALFRKLTGESPRHYLARLRVHRAAQLLGTTDLPVRRIAEQVGYRDPLHFSRAFRQINGHSPTEYRRSRAPEAKPPAV